MARLWIAALHWPGRTVAVPLRHPVPYFFFRGPTWLRVRVLAQRSLPLQLDTFSAKDAVLHNLRAACRVFSDSAATVGKSTSCVFLLFNKREADTTEGEKTCFPIPCDTGGTRYAVALRTQLLIFVI